LQKIKTVRACDFDRHVGQRVVAVGWLITGKIVTTRSQKLMEFMSFEDTTAIYETTFFSAGICRVCAHDGQDAAYLLTGQVQEQQGALTLNVEKVALMDRGIKK
jgi:error-prone DNA polymerase